MAKPFADKAAAQAAAIQAATDYAAAQIQAKAGAETSLLKARAKFQAAQSKIHGNLQQSVFDSHVEAAQAQQQRADEAAAASSAEQTGPPIQQVPLPDARQPSQQLGNGQLTIDPSQVSGGGGVQAASGINGGGPAQVPSTITTQQNQVTTNQGVRYQPSELGANRVPTYNRQEQQTTITRPNVMTPYEAQLLQQNLDKNNSINPYQQQKLFYEGLRTFSQLDANKRAAEASKFTAQLRVGQITKNQFLLWNGQRKATNEVIAQYSQPLADLGVLGLEGALSGAEVAQRRADILKSVPADLRGAVMQQSLSDLAKTQAERTKQGQGTLVQGPGGVMIYTGAGANKVAGQQQGVALNTTRVNAFQGYQASQLGLELSDKLVADMDAHQADYGAVGASKRLASRVVGVVADVIPAMRSLGVNVPEGATAQQAFEAVKTKGAVELLTDPAQLDPDPKVDAQKRQEAVKQWNSLMSTNSRLGESQFTIRMLQALWARALLQGKLNVRGFEALGKENFVDPITFTKDFGTVRGEVQRLHEMFSTINQQNKTTYETITGGGLTADQIMGRAPLPKIETPKPEVTYEDLTGVPSDHIDNLLPKGR